MNQAQFHGLIARTYTNGNSPWPQNSYAESSPEVTSLHTSITLTQDASSSSSWPSKETAVNQEIIRNGRSSYMENDLTFPSQHKQSSIEATIPAQDVPSFLSHYPDSGGIVENSDSTRVESSRKYRVNKISRSNVDSPWQLEKKPSLNSVLEEERLVWLSQSPREAYNEYAGAVRQLPHIPPSSPKSPDAITPATQTSKNHWAEEWAFFDVDAVYCTSQATRQVPRSFAHEEEDDNANDDAAPSLRPPGPRRSMFLEGSMNQGSRATASTWDPLSSKQSSASSVSLQILEQQDEFETTPRPSISGRMSTSSSIDINEFKPLPATPSTFRNTVKRFGQKLKTDSSYAQETIKPSGGSPKKPRKGLRKSMSSWKIFNSSASSDVDNETLSFADKEEVQRVKITNASRTLRHMKFGKYQTESDVPQNSILDERKRKAEIAYAEQFGTSHKKQKASEHEVQTPDDQTTDIEATAIRRPIAVATSRLREIKSTVHKSDRGDKVQFNQTSQAEALHARPTLSTSQATDPPSHPSSRTQLHNLDRSIDRLKRSSRNELEKENQQLRAMLRESQSQTQIRRNTSRARKQDRDGERLSVKKDIGSSALDYDSDYDVLEYYQNGKDAGQPTFAADHSRDERSSHSAPPQGGTIQQSVISDKNVPPVPYLTEEAPGRGMLLPISGNAQRPVDTATVKRWAPARQVDGRIELPRPLSMVLEGLEDEQSDSGIETISKMRRLPSGRSPIKVSYDGSIDDENECEADTTRRAAQKQITTRVEEFSWPEDVF